MPFSPDSDVVVKQLDELNWELRSTLRYEGKVDVFEVPVGQATDFASVPRPFVWFLPRYGAYTKAAILHDFLWRELAAKGEMDWVDADGLFVRAMRELRVPFLRRWIMWTAVRWAALFKPRGRIGWWRESWRVLLATLVAIPFVLPPAILVVVAWAAFFVLELLAWLLIEAGSRARSLVQRGRPRKEIVLPTLELMTQGPAPTVTTPAVPEGSPPAEGSEAQR
ncbi:MAG TPA: DUF1353 domain-containing protein [Actinomycetota bacterium]|nr:DUF1353 domain-containing protein [Actinomycetota bacterium]